MRILYVHQYFSTPRGSSGTRSYEQARLMQAAGHEVLMVTSAAHIPAQDLPEKHGRRRRGQIDGIECIVLDVPYNQRMNYSRRVASFLRFMISACRVALTEPRVDLVFATSTPLTVGVVAVVGRLLRRIPYVFEARDLWPDVPIAMGILKPGVLTRLLKRAERLFYRHACLLVAVNEEVGRRMLQTAGRDVPLVVAPNACDTEFFRPDRDGNTFRKQFRLDRCIACVHTGTMGLVNGLDSVLDAAGALRAHDELRFFLIGSGSEKGRLRRRVADEGLDNVQILDAIPKQDIADVLAAADIGLMTVRPVPILELNSANKFFDYLASGLPIVLNYEGWQARALAEAGAGLSAPQHDTAGFASAIERLAADAELRKTMGLGARRLAEERFDRRKIVGSILQALAAIAKHS